MRHDAQRCAPPLSAQICDDVIIRDASSPFHDFRPGQFAVAGRFGYTFFHDGFEFRGRRWFRKDSADISI
jgi:hypothetical protein